ncbi:hypothetical protein COO60DRAFT_1574977 [Scenedesmus sp. NREL 46B-D3]|nr:hypothetical protein COO60DRAFT_1574977 [Scenedesmus sp. NREL 46B-D3]
MQCFTKSTPDEQGTQHLALPGAVAADTMSLAAAAAAAATAAAAAGWSIQQQVAAVRSRTTPLHRCITHLLCWLQRYLARAHYVLQANPQYITRCTAPAVQAAAGSVACSRLLCRCSAGIAAVDIACCLLPASARRCCLCRCCGSCHFSG